MIERKERHDRCLPSLSLPRTEFAPLGSLVHAQLGAPNHMISPTVLSIYHDGHVRCYIYRDNQRLKEVHSSK